ncbi:MAG: hypothetical protein ACUVR8_01130 [Acidobacteriota bacterium]
MSRHSPKVKAAQRRGAVFEALQQEGFLPVLRGQTSNEYIQQRFGIAPKTFWGIIRELEAERAVLVAPDGLYFVLPQDRW